ncbi:MAG: UDP-glucose 4-epimerase GalE [Ruminococcaceae bacterium]|nr:UDP-glucose 4-epimerase GalE [Oscillospiraceae bacterium]
MSVLLTGGCGYIGSHTAVELINSGYDVILADDLRNSSEIVVERIEQITGTLPKLYKADVTDRAAMDTIFEENDITAVIHFAALKSVPASVANPLEYYRNNISGAITVMESMAAHGCRTLVFSSSATVYGSDLPAPFVETMPLSQPSHPYGRSKQMMEQIITDAAAAGLVDAVLLRYFNPIGAHESGLIGEDPSGVPGNLMPYITQVAIGRRPYLNVYGTDYDTRDGTGLRDYLHVMDLARGHVMAMEQIKPGCDAINLGTGMGTTVLELVSAFETAVGIHVPYEIGPRRAGDIDVILADPKKAELVLGWKAEKTIEDMCRDTWNWQVKNPNGYV